VRRDFYKRSRDAAAHGEAVGHDRQRMLDAGAEGAHGPWRNRRVACRRQRRPQRAVSRPRASPFRSPLRSGEPFELQAVGIWPWLRRNRL